MFDIAELIKRVIKYLVMGFMISLASFLVPKKTKVLDWEEIALIGLSAAATFAILDTYIPSVGVSTRNGLGFALGAGLLGGIPIA
jgi:ABC-type Co2+ transport system permease subunit